MRQAVLRWFLIPVVSGLTLMAGVDRSHADIWLGGDTSGLYEYGLEEYAGLAGYPGEAFVAIGNSTLGITFGEKFVGQVNVSDGDFDVIGGAPSAPLTMDTSIDAVFGINLLAYMQETIIDGLGNVGFPENRAIGTGALTVLYDVEQSIIAFDVTGTNYGELDVQFFDRMGDLLDHLTVTGLANGTYTFSSDAADIAAVTISNFDYLGIAFDNFRFIPAPPGEPSACHAGGPYEGVKENGLAEMALNGRIVEDNDGTVWRYSWTSDCPDSYFDDDTSPTPILFVAAEFHCRLECAVTLIVDNGSQAVACTTPVTVLGGSASVTCPGDLTVECDGAGNEADLEEWLNSAVSDPGTVTHDFGGLSWGCAATGSATVTWEATAAEDDQCGWPATCSATFTIGDTTPPFLELDATFIEVANVDCSEDVFVALPEVTAVDECDANPIVTHDAPDMFPAGQTTTVTYSAVDECGNVARETVDVAVLYGATIEVQVVRHDVGGAGNEPPGEEPLVGIKVSAYDRSRGSCARQQIRRAHGLPREAFEAIYTSCDPINTAITGEDGTAILDLPPGQYMLVAPVDTDDDGTFDRYLGKAIGRLDCGDWKTRSLRLLDLPLDR